MNTKQQLARDVFSEGAVYAKTRLEDMYGFMYIPSTEIVIGGYVRLFSDYEMADLNDKASEIWQDRFVSIFTHLYGESGKSPEDGPWRLEDDMDLKTAQLLNE